MKKTLLIAFIVCFQILNLEAQQSFKPADLLVEWQLLENDYQGKAQFLASFTLTNKGKTPIDLKDFNSNCCPFQLLILPTREITISSFDDKK